MTAILINVLVEAWEFLRVDVAFQCDKHLAHICFRYLLSIQFSAPFHQVHQEVDTTSASNIAGPSGGKCADTACKMSFYGRYLKKKKTYVSNTFE